MVARVLLRRAHACRINTSSSSRRFASNTVDKNAATAGEKSESIFTRDWKVPAAVGFALIGFLQWNHLTHPTEDERRKHPAPALQRLPGHKTAFEETMATERQLESLKLLPYRAASRLWGSVHDKELPTWMRAPLYKAWTAVYDCKLDEMRFPLETYANLGEFFSRPLKDGARVWDRDVKHLPSPVDGRLASIGVVDNASGVAVLEQVKGSRYRLDEFLGELPAFFKKPVKGKKLYQCVLYLAPGDYHRIHSPVDWKVEERRHFPGNLFPVNTTAVRLIPSLFVENERAVLLGEWAHGFFSLTAVGATNVGSIVLEHEPDFRSNTKEQDQEVGKCLTKTYTKPIESHRGDEIAQFKLGSTVVLVFEAPEDFEFTVQPGEKLFLGKSIDIGGCCFNLIELVEQALERDDAAQGTRRRALSALRRLLMPRDANAPCTLGTRLQDFHDPASITDFLARVGVDPTKGLSRDDAMTRRTMYGANRVTPPVNCPSWVCCLLPCLLRTPSMQAYQRAAPREATVKRLQGNGRSRNLRMDATSLVYGDVVEVKAGEVIGADLRIIESSDDCVVDQTSLVGEVKNGKEEGSLEEGNKWPRRKKRVSVNVTDKKDPLISENVLLMTTELVQGTAIGIVIATGDETVWGQMLSSHEWPLSSRKAKRTTKSEQDTESEENEDHALMAHA